MQGRDDLAPPPPKIRLLVTVSHSVHSSYPRPPCKKIADAWKLSHREVLGGVSNRLKSALGLARVPAGMRRSRSRPHVSAVMAGIIVPTIPYKILMLPSVFSFV